MTTSMFGDAIASKLGELVSIKDFGAVGDGATDDTDAIQTAITKAAELGIGGELYFPLGRYVISRTLRVSTPLHLRGTGFGDITGATTNIMQKPNTALVWKRGSGSRTMVRFVAAQLNQTLHGGGIRGIFLDANNEASTCVHISSARESEFDIATYRPKTQAILIDDANGRLLDSVRIPRLVARIGANAKAKAATGIHIKGDISGGGFGCTNVWMGDIDVEYDRGHGIIFEEVDTCTVIRLKGSQRGSGTSPGRAAVFRNGGGSFPAQKNLIVHLARGKVVAEDQCIGNRILYWNSESGGFLASGANLSYAVTDRVHGDTFQGGTIYPMKVNLDIAPGSLQMAGGAVDAEIQSPGWGGVELPSTGSSEVRFSLPPPDSFNNGKILGVRIFSFPSVGAARKSVRLTLEMLSIANGGGTSAVERTKTKTVQLAGARGKLKIIELRFSSQRQINYHRGEWLAGILRRKADSPADRSPQGFIIGGLQLIYECNGPDGGSAGPWRIPKDQLA